MKRFTGFDLAALCLGLAFLYLPVLLVVLYSFNASKLVTVWGGFSLQWYAALWQDEDLLDAARLSLLIGAGAATLSTLLGTSAALALAHGISARGRLPGRQLFAGVMLAPMVLPEVILGVSILLLFVLLEAERGGLTVMLAHATFGTAFALVVIRAKLVTLDPDLEAAARDLGATPWGAFRHAVLPALAPSMAAAWLLAFTLSLDDLVIASFVNGPGATTLPIKIYSSVRLGVTPEINAIATLLIALVAIIVGGAAWLQSRTAATGPAPPQN